MPPRGSLAGLESLTWNNPGASPAGSSGADEGPKEPVRWSHPSDPIQRLRCKVFADLHDRGWGPENPHS
eukprot:9240075-Pyramimonas_sp.AAC.1